MRQETPCTNGASEFVFARASVGAAMERTAWALVGGLIQSRPWPTLLVDPACRALAANTSAAALFDGNGLWALEDETALVTHRDPAAMTRLHAQVRALVEGPRKNLQRTAYFIDSGEGSQTLVTLSAIGGGDALKPLAVMISFVDGQCRQADQAKGLLADLFELTLAEANLALALFEGLSLQAYADQNGKRISTVRWHLRNALAKTGCSSQRDFVRLLISLIES